MKSILIFAVIIFLFACSEQPMKYVTILQDTHVKNSSDYKTSKTKTTVKKGWRFEVRDIYGDWYNVVATNRSPGTDGTSGWVWVELLDKRRGCVKADASLKELPDRNSRTLCTLYKDQRVEIYFPKVTQIRIDKGWIYANHTDWR